MKKAVVFLASALLLATPMMAAAANQGIVGDCSDCHTMHNSVQGQQVAITGLSGTLATTGIQNLLKFDCIACHANPDATTNTFTLPGGSIVPQVYFANAGDANPDLAAGNFWFSDAATGAATADQSQRHGHNVIDIRAADNSNADAFGAPPGNYHASSHGPKFVGDAANGLGTAATDGAVYGAFTCAGARGCHGVRFQLLDNSSGNSATYTYRTGIAAISGAHHDSYDGLKDAGQPAIGVENGTEVADGYRFIPGLKGIGNTAARWQNVDKDSHNEYYGVEGGLDTSAGCETCHESDNGGHNVTQQSVLTVPNQSMSGFCSTCHGMFHSGGATDMDFTEGSGGNDHTPNGVAGAFLRHPSDFALPTDGEYTNYTTYDVTAPVARGSLSGITTDTVVAGSDMVMCLSCHEAHATPNDFMLRFNYGHVDASGDYDASGVMTAGQYADISTAQAQGGCLACHTEKGVLPQSR